MRCRVRMTDQSTSPWAQQTSPRSPTSPCLCEFTPQLLVAGDIPTSAMSEGHLTLTWRVATCDSYTHLFCGIHAWRAGMTGRCSDDDCTPLPAQACCVSYPGCSKHLVLCSMPGLKRCVARRDPWYCGCGCYGVCGCGWHNTACLG